MICSNSLFEIRKPIDSKAMVFIQLVTVARRDGIRCFLSAFVHNKHVPENVIRVINIVKSERYILRC